MIIYNNKLYYYNYIGEKLVVTSYQYRGNVASNIASNFCNLATYTIFIDKIFFVT